MSLPILLDDALGRTADGFALRLSLPWIRSLPVASLSGLEVSIDDAAVTDLRTRPDGEWWFVQDRLVVEGALPLDDGPHDVAVSFRLAIPYLHAGPDAPLKLPFHAARTLVTDATPSRTIPTAMSAAGRSARTTSGVQLNALAASVHPVGRSRDEPRAPRPASVRSAWKGSVSGPSEPACR